MNFARKLKLSFLLLLGTCLSLHAQSTIGTRFWCGFMENIDLIFNDDPLFLLQVDAAQPTTVTISIPATGFSIDTNVPGGTVTEVTFPNAIWYTEGSEFIDNKGILITTNNPVRISAVHHRAFFSESSYLLPEEELGTEYLPICIEDEDGRSDSPSSLIIVSTADNNEIEIQPSVLTLGFRPPELPFTITLNRGQNFQIQALGNLTGTEIRSLSDLPIAVFSGALKANIETCSGGADSHVYDQALPIETWDNIYTFVPFEGQGGDVVQIIAAEQNTSVFIGCSDNRLLNRGESIRLKLTQPTIISANRPISIAQFNSSATCNPSGLGDPNMLQLFPTKLQNNQVQWLASGRPNVELGGQYFRRHFVNIVSRAEDAPSVRLDGADISAGFAPFADDPELVYQQVQVAAGVHELTGDAFQAWSYGFGDFDAYTTNLGFQQEVEVDFACLEINVEGVLCVDSLIQFSTTSNLDIQSWAWDFGSQNTAFVSAPVHIFELAFDWTVTVEVTTFDGDVFTTSITLPIVDCEGDPCEDATAEIGLLFAPTPCIGVPTNFSYTSNKEFQSVSWDFGAAGTSVDSSGSVSFSDPGEVIIRFTGIDALNCEFIQEDTLQLEACVSCPPFNPVDFELVGSPCVDSIFQITVPQDQIFNPTTEVTWQNITTGEIITDLLEIDVQFSAAGTYPFFFFAKDILGCEYIGDFIIQVQECDDNSCQDIPILLEELDPRCVNEQVLFFPLIDIELVSYSWISSSGAVSTNPIFATVFTEPGVYTVNVSGIDVNGCEYNGVTDLEIVNCEGCLNNRPVDIAVPDELCINDTTTFRITTLVPLDILTYDWFSTGDTLIASGSDSTFSLVFEAPGLYNVSISVDDINGCNYTNTVDIELIDCCEGTDSVSIQVDGELCVASSISFVTSTGASLDSFRWVTPGLIDTLTETLDFVFEEPGEYAVQFFGRDAEHCTYEAFQLFIVDNCLECQLNFPNAFTPNNDGINDTFKPVFNCPPDDYNMKIFSRWGNLVFETSDPNDGWDGTFNGQAMSSDVYVRMVQYQIPGEDGQTEAGDLTLIR